MRQFRIEKLIVNVFNLSSSGWNCTALHFHLPGSVVKISHSNFFSEFEIFYASSKQIGAHGVNNIRVFPSKGEEKKDTQRQRDS